MYPKPKHVGNLEFTGKPFSFNGKWMQTRVFLILSWQMHIRFVYLYSSF